MKNYDYILLDWDGNLAKTLDLWLKTFRTVLNEEGYFPSDEDIAGSFGKVDEYFASLGMKDPDAVFDRAHQLGKSQLHSVELYPDALEVLEYFKHIGKKTALITSSDRQNVADLLEHYDMNRLFDVVVTREDTAEHKPHAAPLEKALRELGGSSQHAIMIGDSDKDLGAGLNAGVDTILFYPPEHKKFYRLEALQQLHPTYVVDDFRRIMDIVV
jgi:pyrophosphatase PpaX